MVTKTFTYVVENTGAGEIMGQYVTDLEKQKNRENFLKMWNKKCVKKEVCSNEECIQNMQCMQSKPKINVIKKKVKIISKPSKRTKLLKKTNKKHKTLKK